MPSHVPQNVRWTRYGRWDDSGSTVTNQHGATIYRTPEAIRAAIEAAKVQAFATAPGLTAERLFKQVEDKG